MPTQIRCIPITVVLLCACFIAGCAVAPFAGSAMDAQGKSFSVDRGKANIYLYRNQNLSADPLPVSVNGTGAGATGRATYFLWQVDPGTYDISAGSDNTAAVHIVAEGGKSYYVWQEVKLDRSLFLLDIVVAKSDLRVVDEEIGRVGVSECNRLQSKL